MAKAKAGGKYKMSGGDGEIIHIKIGCVRERTKKFIYVYIGMHIWWSEMSRMS